MGSPIASQKVVGSALSIEPVVGSPINVEEGLLLAFPGSCGPVISGIEAQQAAASPAPRTPSVAGSPTPPFVTEFIAGLKAPILQPQIQSPPRVRVSRPREENLVPRRSGRLAAKSVYRDPKPEHQAKRVMLRRWRPASASASRSSPPTPDNSIATRFCGTFVELITSSKQAAMRELFPRATRRRGRSTPVAS